MRDCLFLVADSNMKATLEGFLTRDQFHLSLGCGVFSFDLNHDLIVAAGDNDPGLYTRGHEILRPYLNTHQHAVVILDAEWEGSHGSEEIKKHITDNLILSGWKTDNCKVVVIDPELENWIWQENQHVAKAIGLDTVQDFDKEPLIKDNWPEGNPKPDRPKETLEAVLKKNRIPRSSSIYKGITSQVSVQGCQDSSFIELRETLQQWFPVEEN